MKNIYKTIMMSVVVNTLLVILKVGVGIVTNTKSLIADGLHSLSDLSTDVMAFVGQKLSAKKADEKHPMGHGKIEYITSAIIGIVVVYVSGTLMKIAILAHPRTIEISVMYVALATTVIKFFIAKYVYSNGRKYHNNILLASAKENYNDVISSLAVFITVISSNLSSYAPILKYSDKVGTFIISLLILRTGFSILKDNLSLIIGENETNEEILSKVKEAIKEVDGIEEINSLTLIKSGSYYEAIVKIAVNPTISIKEAHIISKNVKDKLLNSNLNINFVTMHVNPNEEDN